MNNITGWELRVIHYPSATKIETHTQTHTHSCVSAVLHQSSLHLYPLMLMSLTSGLSSKYWKVINQWNWRTLTVWSFFFNVVFTCWTVFTLMLQMNNKQTVHEWKKVFKLNLFIGLGKHPTSKVRIPIKWVLSLSGGCHGHPVVLRTAAVVSVQHLFSDQYWLKSHISIHAGNGNIKTAHLIQGHEFVDELCWVNCALPYADLCEMVSNVMLLITVGFFVCVFSV